MSTIKAGTTSTTAYQVEADTTGNLVFQTNGTTTAMTINTSQNMGLGVTPPAWWSGGKAMHLNVGAFILGSSTQQVLVGTNFYYDGSANKYIGNGEASYYEQNASVHKWYVAPSGSAGGTVTFTQAMTLDASGNLGVGTTSPGAKLDVSSAGIVSARINNTASSSDAYLICKNTSGESFFGVNATGPYIYTATAQAMTFHTNNTERARITSAGLWLVGVTTSANNSHRIAKAVGSQGDTICEIGDTGTSYFIVYQGGNVGWNAAASAAKMGSNSVTGRSLNASGTLNASGADYAEYMTKDGDFNIAKGDVCGIDANGKLTNVFANAISFVVKSSDPAYVGNDKWGIGITDPVELEEARKKVDRIAFAGQLPVNVLGATPGQYIVPVDDNGAIKGVAVSNPTFEQYQSAVGKVISVQDDGRAWIIVKVA